MNSYFKTSKLLLLSWYYEGFGKVDQIFFIMKLFPFNLYLLKSNIQFDCKIQYGSLCLQNSTGKVFDVMNNGAEQVV